MAKSARQTPKFEFKDLQFGHVHFKYTNTTWFENGKAILVPIDTGVDKLVSEEPVPEEPVPEESIPEEFVQEERV